MAKPKNKTKNLDRVTLLIGLCMPIVTLPQLYSVIKASNIHGVSFITWLFYTVQAGIFALFAVKHKERPLIFTYAPLFLIEVGIVVVLSVRTF